jgi:hypothetical protein
MEKNNNLYEKLDIKSPSVKGGTETQTDSGNDYKYIFLILFFLMGLINNLGYSYIKIVMS